MFGQAYNFDVEEYVSSAFKLEAENNKEEYIDGDNLKLSIQADYYFATNPYVQAETLQRVDIRVPGTGWLQKKAIMDHLKPVLGAPVPTRPKGAPKNSPLVWRWKVGKGKAWLVEAAGETATVNWNGPVTS